jgi:hypothetical protein
VARSLGGTLIAIVLGLIASLVLGGILGAVFELILYYIVRPILGWLASAVGFWIFPALAGLYLGGIVGGVVGALIGLLLHRWRWSTLERPRLWAAFRAAFFSVLGAVAAWIALTSYGITFSGALQLANGALLGAFVGGVAGLIVGLLAGAKKIRLLFGAVSSAAGAAIFGVYFLPYLATSIIGIAGFIVGALLGILSAYNAVAHTH